MTNDDPWAKYETQSEGPAETTPQNESSEAAPEEKPLFYDAGSEAEFSDEDLEEMKLMGLPKPDNVEWGRWIGPKSHSHRHELLIHMAASGLSNNQIAEELQYSQSRVSVILSQPEIRNKIRLLQEKVWGGNASQKFQSLVHDAIDVTEEIMNNRQEKGATRLSAANNLLDRALGKATQKIDVESTSLGEVLDRLDQLKELEKNNTYQEPALLEKTKNPEDAFLDSFIEADYVVGERKAEENGEG